MDPFQEALPRMVQGPMLLVVLLLAVAFIVISTAKWKLHPFIALLLAAYGTAFAVKMPSGLIATAINNGFGSLMTSIGLVIVMGTIIGSILEKSGAALKMADVVLRWVGEKRPALAMSIIGYIVSIPVFCDSGFVILASLKKALAKRSGVPVATLAVALATGLYATHTLVPPTPGPIAAAANLGLLNLGLVIGVGLVVALPAAVAGYLWATRVAKTIKVEGEETGQSYEELVKSFGTLPSAWKSFAPIVVPIILIGLGSVATLKGDPFGTGFLKSAFVFLGAPLNALFVGFLFSFLLLPGLNEETLSKWIGASLKDAAGILLITGAGGALGKVLSSSPIGSYLGATLMNLNLPSGLVLLLPFIIAAALKTAQGSSTVALVTTSTLVAPLLAQLGLDTEWARVLVVMAVGAGAMTVSHANDSYFWVVSQFSGMRVQDAYKAQTAATLVQGIVTIITVLVLAAFTL